MKDYLQIQFQHHMSLSKGLFVLAYRLYNLDYNLNYIIQIII
jgi:hypothetical protein